MTSTAQRRGCSMRWPPATMRKSRRRQTTSPAFNVGPDASASGRTRSGSGLVDAPGRFVAGRGPAGLQARHPRSAPYQVNQRLHQTGALAAYGFRESVDWLPSAAFEMLVIGCLLEVSFTRPGMRKLERELKDSAPGLFPKAGLPDLGEQGVICPRSAWLQNRVAAEARGPRPYPLGVAQSSGR